MQTRIDITAMEPMVYGVQVTEGDTTTSHRVRVSNDVVDAVVPGDPGDEALYESLVRESIAFLLEREPATEILDTFSLDQIAHYFPEYSEEIVTRMSNFG